MYQKANPAVKSVCPHVRKPCLSRVSAYGKSKLKNELIIAYKGRPRAAFIGYGL